MCIPEGFKVEEESICTYLCKAEQRGELGAGIGYSSKYNKENFNNLIIKIKSKENGNIFALNLSPNFNMDDGQVQIECNTSNQDNQLIKGLLKYNKQNSGRVSGSMNSSLVRIKNKERRIVPEINQITNSFDSEYIAGNKFKINNYSQFKEFFSNEASGIDPMNIIINGDYSAKIKNIPDLLSNGAFCQDNLPYTNPSNIFTVAAEGKSINAENMTYQMYIYASNLDNSYDIQDKIYNSLCYELCEGESAEIINQTLTSNEDSCEKFDEQKILPNNFSEIDNCFGEPLESTFETEIKAEQFKELLKSPFDGKDMKFGNDTFNPFHRTIDAVSNDTIGCLLDEEEKLDDSMLSNVRRGSDKLLSWIPLVGTAYDGVKVASGQSIVGKVSCGDKMLTAAFMSVEAAATLTITAASTAGGAATGTIVGPAGTGTGAFGGLIGSKFTFKAIKDTTAEILLKGGKNLVKSFSKESIKKVVKNAIKEYIKGELKEIVSDQSAIALFGYSKSELKELFEFAKDTVNAEEFEYLAYDKDKPVTLAKDRNSIIEFVESFISGITVNANNNKVRAFKKGNNLGVNIPKKSRSSIFSFFANQFVTIEKIKKFKPKRDKVKLDAAQKKLDDLGIKGIQYNKYGDPIFDTVARDTIKYPQKFGGTRKSSGAEIKFANDEYEKYKNEKIPIGFVWHHDADCRNLYLIPIVLHDAFRHTGGTSRAKNNQCP